LPQHWLFLGGTDVLAHGDAGSAWAVTGAAVGSTERTVRCEFRLAAMVR
jgi:hypothetical protein